MWSQLPQERTKRQLRAVAALLTRSMLGDRVHQYRFWL